VTDDTILQEFHEELLSSVAERARELSTTRQEAFTQMALEELSETGAIGSDFEVCYLRKKLGRGMGRVNGYAISESEARLDLFTTIFRADALTVLKQKEVDDAFVQASRVFRFAEDRGYEQMEPASAERLMLERLHGAHSSVATLRITLLTNAVAPPGLKKRAVPGLEVTSVVECYDLGRHHRWKSSSKPYESITIDLRESSSGPLPCLRSKVPGAEHDVYMAIIPGELLFRLYEEYGARLMELNVRSYLQNRGKVNRGIRETIMTEPGRFLAYNNGISATAEEVTIENGPDGPVIVELCGFQVVNGGQTVASIHRAGKVDEADLASIEVQAKISVVPSELVESLVPRISRYANTQNRVNEADFSANAPFHVEMEQLSRRVWAPGEQSRWFYERARGQYEVQRARDGRTPAQRRTFDAANPKKQKFDKTDVARWMNTWSGLPHIVSLGSQKNFASFMAVIGARAKDWLPDTEYYKQVVARGIVFRAAESIARAHRFPAYRASAICYTVAYFVYRAGEHVDLGDIWTRQAIPEALNELLVDWMTSIHKEVVRTAEGRNVTEWAKKEACWHGVQRLDLELDESIAIGLGITPKPPLIAHEGIDAVMAVDGGRWIAIRGWAECEGAVAGEHLTVLSDLAIYASAGWRRLPSADECQVAVAVLTQATDAGFLTDEDA
jgi:hypothetical protein